ncbi:Uncharacterized protein Adt_26859 [Abeliophyllum distichum]|uniref:Uncharacterized protein n=1 Tax=Abeliophyllum distichum TaxID=126358 RepID=A0ABD1RSB7_9LAMI
MNKDISRVSATSQKELLARLSKDLADALKRQTLELSVATELTLKGIHQEVSLLLSENVELRAKKMSFIQVMAKKESLNIEISSAKSKLNELSSEVMVEDSLLMSLESKMKEIQAKIADCKTRLASKKRNTSLEIERTKALMAHYSEVTMDDPGVVMESCSLLIFLRDLNGPSLYRGGGNRVGNSSEVREGY